jgi:toxin ParE1/3/4
LNLVWLPSAIANRDSQLEYIARNNVRAAIEQGDRIAKQVVQLIEHPEIGRQGRIEGTRELVVSRTPFILVYRINSDRIELIRLLHGAQQWPPLQK